MPPALDFADCAFACGRCEERDSHSRHTAANPILFARLSPKPAAVALTGTGRSKQRALNDPTGLGCSVLDPMPTTEFATASSLSAQPGLPPSGNGSSGTTATGPKSPCPSLDRLDHEASPPGRCMSWPRMPCWLGDSAKSPTLLLLVRTRLLRTRPDAVRWSPCRKPTPTAFSRTNAGFVVPEQTRCSHGTGPIPRQPANGTQSALLPVNGKNSNSPFHPLDGLLDPPCQLPGWQAAQGIDHAGVSPHESEAGMGALRARDGRRTLQQGETCSFRHVMIGNRQYLQPG